MSIHREAALHATVITPSRALPRSGFTRHNDGVQNRVKLVGGVHQLLPADLVGDWVASSQDLRRAVAIQEPSRANAGEIETITGRRWRSRVEADSGTGGAT